MSEQQLTDQQILAELFETAATAPEESVFIKRLGLRVTLNGLTSSRVDSIRERCTSKKNVKGMQTEKLDNELFNSTLIQEATKGIEVIRNYGEQKEQRLVLKGWGDERITSQLKLSGGDQAVRRLLLAGELDAVGDKVLELSGFGVDIEEVKN
ncbi:phage tail assembly chaperone [Paenibacillus sp. FSL R10-2771]|uniref:phage tail assembly chaperone n=1 Tax=Paenibacillus sp. FSL R10-2771 TaxID=2954693 RepID=UPI0030F4FFAE